MGAEAQWRITGWGWYLAFLSVMPLIQIVTAAQLEWWFAALTITPCNVGFIAAALALWFGRRRLAIACAAIALASMIYGGFLIERYPSDLVRLPYGYLGPGYYVWVIAGALMLWTAFSSRSAP